MRRGLSQKQLAEAAGISYSSLAGYLRGDREPLAHVRDALSRALQFPVDFLMGDTPPVPERDGVSFRALTSMTAAQRDQAIGAAGLALEFAAWVDERLQLPEPQIPLLDISDPELAADALRAEWGLGEARIPNMIALLESKGVRVFSLPEESHEVDGYSFWHGSTPVVFLSTAKSGERSRMDAAHELGHLVLHFRGGSNDEMTDSRRTETEARRFAGAFLMPRSGLAASIERNAPLDRILQVKQHWRVSAAAMVFRLHEIGLLTEWDRQQLNKALSQAGYREREPHAVQRETSALLPAILERLREKRITRAQIADALRFPPEELNRLLFGLLYQQLEGGEEQAPAQSTHDLRLL